MSLEFILNALPEAAKDIKINFNTILNADTLDLSAKQKAVVMLACAYATQSQIIIENMMSEFQAELSDVEKKAAQTAAIMMAMNNVYYRFTHLVSDPIFQNMPAQLRMTSLTQHQIAVQDFELMCLAVSCINGCGKCMDAHTQVLLKSGVNVQTIQSVVRIASIIQATALGIKINSE